METSALVIIIVLQIVNVSPQVLASDEIQPEAVTAWLEKALTIGAPIVVLLAFAFLLGLYRDDNGRWMVRGTWGSGPTPVSTMLWGLAVFGLLFWLLHELVRFWYGK